LWQRGSSKVIFRLAPRFDHAARPSVLRDTWADFVFESRQVTSLGARIGVALGLLAALVRVAFASIPQGPPPMRNFRLDVVQAARRLRRSPLYTGFAAVTLGIGIAATTSLYALLYSIVWRPDATVAPEQIVELRGNAVNAGAGGVPGRFSWPDWESLRDQQNSFSQLAGSLRLGVSIAIGDVVDVVTAEAVTSDYFSLVGVRPLHGRVLGAADSPSGSPPVAVINARLARAYFGDEASAVGGTIKVGGQLTEIVGVVTDDFYGFGITFAPSDLWLPVEQTPRLTPVPYSSFDPARRDRRWLSVRARLKEGVTLPKAAEEVSLIGQRLESAFPSAATPDPKKGPPAGRYWTAQPVSTREADTFSSLGLALMVGVSLVLLMVCSNLASLGLSRSAARQPEFAVRRALGASRWRLVREQVVECGLVVGLGAVLALWGTRWLTSWMHTDVPISRGTNLTLQPEITWPVVAAAAGAAILSLLFVGLGPALRATRASLRPLMAQDGATTRPRVRSQHMLVAAQVAGSTALMLLAVSIMNVVTRAAHSPGVDLDRLALAAISFYQSPREPIEADRLRDDILQRMRETPGVESAAAAVGMPFGMSGAQGSIAASERELSDPKVEGGENAYLVYGTEGILETLGVPVLKGRAISSDEVREKRPAIVISEKIAKAVFGSTDIVGRSLWFRSEAPVKSAIQSLTVVGVSADTDTFSMGTRRSGVAFLPFARDPRDSMVLVVRGEGDTTALAGTLRKTIRTADPGLVVDRAGSGWTILSGRYLFLGALGWASTALGGLTLVLVMTGLFGVLSALVTQQTREFGIRMALGGTSRDVLQLVLWQGLRPARDGLIVGLILGVLSRLALRGIFSSGMAVIDVFAFVLVPLVIIATTVASSLLPARRAASVDPSIALRTQ
jgi:predicted permease